MIAQHKKMIDIIENKEIDQVEKIMREHILDPRKVGETCINLVVFMQTTLKFHIKNPYSWIN